MIHCLTPMRILRIVQFRNHNMFRWYSSLILRPTTTSTLSTRHHHSVPLSYMVSWVCSRTAEPLSKQCTIIVRYVCQLFKCKELSKLRWPIHGVLPLIGYRFRNFRGWQAKKHLHPISDFYHPPKLLNTLIHRHLFVDYYFSALDTSDLTSQAHLNSFLD